MNKTDFIKQCFPFWRQLNDDEKQKIETGLVARSFSKGELLLGNNESCMGMIAVESGDVRVSIVSEDGRQITLFHVEAGEVCVTTASCVIAQLTFDTIISAEEDTVIWVIPSAVLGKLSKSNIYVKAYMYELLTERFSSVVWVMEQILFKRFDKRLAEFLVSQAEKSGSMEIKMTQEEIAVEVNTAREVVARMLKQFSTDKLVELKRGKIVIKNPGALKIL